MTSSRACCFCFWLMAAIAISGVTQAEVWTVTLTIHEILSLSDDDASGEDDLYTRAFFVPLTGQGSAEWCSTFAKHKDDDNHVFPDWQCTYSFDGGQDAEVRVILEVLDHDTTSPDDLFDIHPAAAQGSLVLDLRPATMGLKVDGLAGWNDYRCSQGPITSQGQNGDDRARVKVTLSANPTGDPAGDVDADGLLDAWEICGYDADGDGTVDVDLPALGADPYRKDLFVEIDWMTDPSGTSTPNGIPHSHEPWLPALRAAWFELDQTPVTNPPKSGLATRPGIAFHADVGTLYAGYTLDFDGDGTAELSVPASGNLDLDGDGIPDIGNLAALGTGGDPPGGNQVAEIFALSNAGNPDLGFEAVDDAGMLKAANFDPARGLIFNYVLFVHRSWIFDPSAPGESPTGIYNGRDFVVSLGDSPTQQLDTDGDGLGDPGTGAPLPGPSGLPVHGPIQWHEGTFLHELGHTLKLDHAGPFSGPLFLPNYHSMMNYLFQLNTMTFDSDGDLMADPVGVDFTGDGIADAWRFLFSSVDLPTLDETDLDEAKGISSPLRLLVSHTCPGVGGQMRVDRADGAFDWNCNGNPSDSGVIADVNGDGTLGKLPGSADWPWVLAIDGFDHQKGESTAALFARRARTLRVVEITGQDRLQALCPDAAVIGFDDAAPGDDLAQRYAPQVSFESDGEVLAFRPREMGLPTRSPDLALIDRKPDTTEPLMMVFDRPQRIVAMHVGRRQGGDPSDIFAYLRAYDDRGLPLGEVKRPLPLPPDGLRHLLAVGAIFPDQKIQRLEIGFWGHDPPEEVKLDDLILCSVKTPPTTPPDWPPPPEFGDLPVTVTLRAEWLRPNPRAVGDGEHGHQPLMTQLLPNFELAWQGGTVKSGGVFEVAEGTKIELTAPNPDTHRLHFLYWRWGDGTHFQLGQNEITVQPIHDVVLTAVYGNPVHFPQLKKPRRPPVVGRPTAGQS